MKPAKFFFRLYIAGDTQNSAQAVANLTALCKLHLSTCHEIEFIDVLREPERALADGVFMTPTLVRVAPIPPQKIVGTLNRKQPLLRAMGLEGEA